MALLDLHQAEFLFHSDGLADTTLNVFRFTGRESLSQQFEFQIELVADNPNLDLTAPIGQPASLTFRGRLYDGSRYSRFVQGIVEEFVLLAAGIRHSRYCATLVPSTKPLHFTRNSRIFQSLSGPAVAEQVLKDARISADQIHSMLHGSYGARDYCVQYQESDLNFVQRLWEEEGIFYFFEHTKEKDKLNIGDGAHAFASLSDYSEALYRDQPHQYEEGIFEFRAGSALRPGCAMVRDFRFKQPSLDMEAKSESNRFPEYKMYYFPGEYVDPALGNRLAKIRLEEQQCQQERFVGCSNVRAMLPGYKFSLAGHRRSDCNQEYLIVSVEHEGSQPQALGEESHSMTQASYQNRLICIPARIPFRPMRQTTPPRISGVQTAIVVGPPGEEIHCDSHGRVKVQFHWDREGKKDDNSSCWIRVSQPWGGTGQGGMFIPRVNQEVVVQFLEGDPDRPLIVGRVYNGENPVPHDLPAAKNISTIRSASTPGGDGFNEIKFDDSKGEEEMFIHAQFDRNEVTEHDQTLKVVNNQTENVGVDRTRQVGHDENISVGNDRSRQVGNDESIQIGTNRTKTIGGNETITISGNQSQTVVQNQTLHVKGAQSLNISGTQSSTVSQAASETIGLAKALSVGAAYQISVGGAMNTTVGAASAEEVGLTKTTIVGLRADIIVGAAKIHVEKSGKITIEGTEFVLKSSGPVTFNGTKVTVNSEELTLKASGKAELQGSSVQITGNPIDLN